jgi:hypothetical protein
MGQFVIVRQRHSGAENFIVYMIDKLWVSQESAKVIS